MPTATKTPPQTPAQNDAEWVAIAARVVRGEFDEITRRTRRPPEGSLRESLIIGLRGQARVAVVAQALQHLKYEP